MQKTILVVFFILPLLLYSQNQKKLDSLDHLVKQSKENNSWKTTIALLYNKGKLYNSEKNYEDAQQQFLKVDSIAKTYNYIDENTVLASIKRSEISYSTFSRDGVETANTLLIQALDDAQKLNNEALIHNVYKVLAYIKFLTDETDASRSYLDLATPYYLKIDDARSVSWLYDVYSFYFIKVDSIKNAEDIRLKSVDYLRKQNDSIALAKAISSIGDFYSYRLKQHRKALPYLNEAKVIYEKTHDTLIRQYLYLIENLAICNAETGRYQLAYDYYKKAYNLRKDIVRESNDVTTRRLEAKFQAKEKEQEIALLKSENELIEQKRKNQRNTLLGGLGFAGIGSLFLFVLFRNRKRTADKLKQLDTAKSKFFANISHEFRTPLTLIANPIEQALQDKSMPDKKREQFKMAKRNSDRLLSLVNQLLDLSKIDAGQLKLRIQKGNVTQLIAALGESFSYSAKQKDIDFNIRVNQHDSEVYFDQDAIEKILVNLLSNAIKYTPKEGSVVCKAQIQDGQLLLEVKNTGKGLTQEELKNIFQRFYQTSEDNVGTGIGLALVKELVDLHKGTITVESRPNEWTTFSIRLPVAENSFKNAQFIDAQKTDVAIAPILDSNVMDSEEETADTNQPILLIVEDNQDVRTLLKQTFEDTYNVISAPDGEKGVVLALEHIPDIIISDIMMPVKDGITLTKELKNDERTSHIPIILLTAKAGNENELKGVEIGADDYITKPFSSKILRVKVAKLIEMRQKLQSRYSQELILLPKDIAGNNLDEQFLEKVQAVMDEKLVESSFSIADFSKAVGMSRMQLHRKIKAITGLSAGDFIRSQRLKLAADLLKKSDINISEIGYMVGFNDHSYFTKCFKEAYGATPTAFAKKQA